MSAPQARGEIVRPRRVVERYRGPLNANVRQRVPYLSPDLCACARAHWHAPSVLAVFALLMPNSALACLCSCDPRESGITVPSVQSILASHDLAFSGLVVSVSLEPMTTQELISRTGSKDNFGQWAHARVLALRTWKGEPETFTDVWTPLVTSCDVEPTPATKLIALANMEDGRAVVSNTYCNCEADAVATHSGASFMPKGVAILVFALCAFASLVLVGVRTYVTKRRARSGVA